MRLGILLTVLLLALGSVCFGSDYQVYYHTKGDSAGGVKVAAIGDSQATTGFDQEYLWTGSTPEGVLIGIHKTNGTDGWNSTTGFYADDARPAPTQGNSTTIGDICIWASSGLASQNLHLCLDPATSLATGLTCKLYLVSVPNGITYSGPTEWTIPHSDIVLPFYSTSDGTTGYKFRIEITAAQ